MHYIITTLLFIALVCTIILLLAWYHEHNRLKHPDMFLKESKNKIEKLIMIRERLIKDGRSKKSSIDATRVIQQLRYWMAQNNDSPSMARLIRKHTDLLFLLLPGEGSRCHKKLAEELNELIDTANTIIKN